jgi:phosphoribosylaminoimidazolecarboxamide formyltransferase/IMP cyclohydrolase
MNRTVDLAAAQAITAVDKLLEVIVAPGFDPDALQLLRDRWKNVRLLAVGPLGHADPGDFMMHRIVGGYLLQQRDLAAMPDLQVVSKRKPSEQELADMQIAWLACKHVKSNAIVIARDCATVGIGGGQVDRVNAARIAIQKAGGRAVGAVAASDAFFPFPDGPELLLQAGITAIIHPGGSVRDQQTLELVDRHNAAMVLTGCRHFRH